MKTDNLRLLKLAWVREQCGKTYKIKQILGINNVNKCNGTTIAIKVSIQSSETSPRLSLCLSIKMKILHLLVLVRCALKSTS